MSINSKLSMSRSMVTCDADRNVKSRIKKPDRPDYNNSLPEQYPWFILHYDKNRD